MIYCKFTRAQEYQNDEEIFNLTTGNKYYLLTASGETNSQEPKNHYDDKTASYLEYDFTKVSSFEDREIDLNECDKTKRCFRQPFSCINEVTCDKIITWKEHLNTIEFEIFGKKEFIAIAFSRDMMMKDSSIIACAKRKGHAEIHYYFAYGNSFWDVEFKRLKGIEILRKDVESDFIRCKFRRQKHFSDDQDLFDLSRGNRYHLLVAGGHLGFDGKIAGHEKDRLATFRQFDFSEEIPTSSQTTFSSNSLPTTRHANSSMTTSIDDEQTSSFDDTTVTVHSSTATTRMANEQTSHPSYDSTTQVQSSTATTSVDNSNPTPSNETTINLVSSLSPTTSSNSFSSCCPCATTQPISPVTTFSPTTSSTNWETVRII